MNPHSIDDLKSTTFGGRRFTRKQIATVQQTVSTFTNLSRRELAHTVCEHLQWYTPNGKNKIQSCLGMLERLEQLGVLTLPEIITAHQRGPQKKIAQTTRTDVQPDITAKLEQLTPLHLQVATDKDDITLWNEQVDRHHYLGYRQPIGPNLRYFILDCQQRKLGCLLFSYASTSLRCRDEWIGWQDLPYKKHLHLIVNNNRFLIFPWVKVKCLASKVLSIAARQLADDWHTQHGYSPVLLETFVDLNQFKATCYRAANWHYLGQTKGQTATKSRRGKPAKGVFVYPLVKHAKSRLIEGQKTAAKRSHARPLSTPKPLSTEDPFIQLWQKIIHTVTRVTRDFDAQWQKRQRTLNTLLIVLFIFRLVFSKNRQGYAITITELWDQCRMMGIPLPQSSPVAASAFCAARAKLDAQVFKILQREIVQKYRNPSTEYRWKGHDIYAVDGSKMNLPRPLLKQGYRTPSDHAHYPQGLLSCLYQLKSKIPVDFDLVSHGDERRVALTHLAALHKNDVVVYDRGYFSYALLEEHIKRGINPVFRIKTKAGKVVDAFIASTAMDQVVEIPASQEIRAERKKQDPNACCKNLRLRLVKYTLAETTYVLGTTLLDQQRYPIKDLSTLYHSRWGIEELYKVSKQLMTIEEFHGQSERGIKQELFAHFILITLTRIFSNHSEAHFNSQGTAHQEQETKANFKNALVTVARNIEGLLLQQAELINTTIHRIVTSIFSCRQKLRPNRSYERRSRKPVGKWMPTKSAKPIGKQPVTA